MLLEGKVALVTGGTRGLGRAISCGFVREGATVIATYAKDSVSAQETLSLIKKINPEAKCETMQLLVEDYGHVTNVVRQILEKYGTIHILVNNAGIAGDETPLWETSFKQWKEVIDTNLLGVINCSKAVLTKMIENKYGKIINISSAAIFLGSRMRTAYDTSKAAIVGFSRSLAKEVGMYNICVNVVSPGPIMTEMLSQFSNRRAFEISAILPIGRYASPEEISEVVIFLASDRASYIIGSNIIVDGGISI